MAEAYGIQISQPRYGVSSSEYFFNKERKMIAKGVGSIKHISGSVATDLLSVAKEQPTNFIDLLILADHKYHIGLAKIEILIKLNFFSDFGNRNELLKIFKFYTDFCKRGAAKNLSNSKLEALSSDERQFIKCGKYTNNLSSKGTILQTHTIIDIDGLMHDYESLVKESGLADWGYEEIIEVQNEYLGTVDLVTYKKEDRQKLLVTDVKQLSNNGEVWGYALFTKSIGTGKTSRITARAERFNSKPLNTNSIIFVRLSDLWKNKKGYWNIENYEVLKE